MKFTFPAHLVLLSSLWSQPVQAQFGLGMRKPKTDPNDPSSSSSNDNPPQQQHQAVSDEDILNSNGALGGLDFENDPELVEALQIFAGMSEEEMEETMRDLIALLGDDPETLAAIQQVLDEIPNMKHSEIQSSLKDMVAQDEIAAATEDALHMLASAEWNQIWEKQALILEAVIESGNISEEDAQRYKSDVIIWEHDLKQIWSELQQQIGEEAASQAGQEF